MAAMRDAKRRSWAGPFVSLGSLKSSLKRLHFLLFHRCSTKCPISLLIHLYTRKNHTRSEFLARNEYTWGVVAICFVPGTGDFKVEFSTLEFYSDIL